MFENELSRPICASVAPNLMNSGVKNWFQYLWLFFEVVDPRPPLLPELFVAIEASGIGKESGAVIGVRPASPVGRRARRPPGQ